MQDSCSYIFVSMQCKMLKTIVCLLLYLLYSVNGAENEEVEYERSGSCNVL